MSGNLEGSRLRASASRLGLLIASAVWLRGIGSTEKLLPATRGDQGTKSRLGEPRPPRPRPL